MSHVYKRARRTSELEAWLHSRSITADEAVREACAYASTVDELVGAPPEDLSWLTEAWEPGTRDRFLLEIGIERENLAGRERGGSGGGGGGGGSETASSSDAREPEHQRLDALVAMARNEPEEDGWGHGGEPPSDDAVARLLTSIPTPTDGFRGDGQRAMSFGAASDGGLSAGGGPGGGDDLESRPRSESAGNRRSEAHRLPRFRMSILTDYAGTISETVTDEAIGPVDEDQMEVDDQTQLDFKSLLNFDKVSRGENKRCVMCGRHAEAEDRRVGGCLPETCVIPKQCKDVCDACTKSTWRHRASAVVFKWCQGCKKFRAIGAFAFKRHTAKCDSCRKRGRQGYHNKVKARETTQGGPADLLPE